MDPDVLLHVRATDPTPPFEQLRRQLAELITSGRLEDGQRLPPVRQLAADLGLAAGTVARTYKHLESEGLVTTRRGGGTRVNRDPDTHPAPARAEDLAQEATAFVRRAWRSGATEEQIRQALDCAIKHADGSA